MNSRVSSDFVAQEPRVFVKTKVKRKLGGHWKEAMRKLVAFHDGEVTEAAHTLCTARQIGCKGVPCVIL